MELRQLEYFVAVAEEATFTRAAQRVRISQSGVSAQVRQLEHELGAALLDRSARSATVTAAGAAALPHARAALASVRALRGAVDDVTGLVRGRLSVGMVSGCTVTPFFAALAAFHADRPGIEIDLFEDNSDRLVEAVRGGAADLALVGAAGTLPEGLDGLPVVSEPIVAAVPAGHPLAGRDRVPLARLCRYPLVCLPEGTGIRGVFDGACAAKGLRPDVALQASAPAAVADLAARGFGAAILSRSMADRDDLTVLALDGVPTPALLAVVWRAASRTALGAAPRELIRHCRRTFGAQPPGPPGRRQARPGGPGGT
jgi:DNA-binding transcriptional LysR family regulator